MLALGWDETALAYERYFVPRFAPWVTLAVDELPRADVPSGAVVAPCCGTGPELHRAATVLPGRDLVGVDLSPEMVRLARARLAHVRTARVLEGDASSPGPDWPRPCAAVVSAFGLQQLPEPDVALAAWGRTLAPGGALSVVFWPSDMDAGGPFGLLVHVLAARVPAPDTSWEARLVPSLVNAGLRVERDEAPSFAMEHEDAATFWDAAASSGPFRAIVATRGETLVAEAREDFLRAAPAGRWAHQPRARWLYARR